MRIADTGQDKLFAHDLGTHARLPDSDIDFPGRSARDTLARYELAGDSFPRPGGLPCCAVSPLPGGRSEAIPGATRRPRDWPCPAETNREHPGWMGVLVIPPRSRDGSRRSR